MVKQLLISAAVTVVVLAVIARIPAVRAIIKI